MNVQSAIPTVDLSTIKGRQQLAWGSGDYAIVGTTLQIVGETLCEAVDLRSNQRVLDVAAGNGNATLAAARRFADVVSTDYVGALLEGGRRRAEADRLPVTFQEADAEALPFADASFDVVLSTFGVMFTPNQEKAAGELLRVCRPGGKIGLANWTPDSFIGQMFKILGKYVPPAAGIAPPSLWGTKARLDALFGAQAVVAAESRNFVFRYKSPAHWLEIFRDYYGPVLKAFAALAPEARTALEKDLLRPARQAQCRPGRHAGSAQRVSRSGHHQEELIPTVSGCRGARCGSLSATGAGFIGCFFSGRPPHSSRDGDTVPHRRAGPGETHDPAGARRRRADGFPAMTAAAKALAEAGFRVARFEFDYMARRRSAGRKPPPRAEKLCPGIPRRDRRARRQRTAHHRRQIDGRAASRA